MLILALVVMSAVRCLTEPSGGRELARSLRLHFFAWTGALACGTLAPAILLMPYWRAFGASPRREWWEVSLFLPTPRFWFQPLQQSL